MMSKAYTKTFPSKEELQYRFHNQTSIKPGEDFLLRNSGSKFNPSNNIKRISVDQNYIPINKDFNSNISIKVSPPKYRHLMNRNNSEITYVPSLSINQIPNPEQKKYLGSLVDYDLKSLKENKNTVHNKYVIDQNGHANMVNKKQLKHLNTEIYSQDNNGLLKPESRRGVSYFYDKSRSLSHGNTHFNRNIHYAKRNSSNGNSDLKQKAYVKRYVEPANDKKYLISNNTPEREIKQSRMKMNKVFERSISRIGDQFQIPVRVKQSRATVPIKERYYSHREGPHYAPQCKIIVGM